MAVLQPQAVLGVHITVPDPPADEFTRLPFRPLSRSLFLWLTCLLVSISCPSWGEAQQLLDSEISEAVAAVNRALALPAAARREALLRVVDEHVDVAHVAEQVFGDYVEDALVEFEKLMEEAEFRRFDAAHRSRIDLALRQRIAADLDSFFLAANTSHVRASGVESSDRDGIARVTLRSAGMEQNVECRLRRHAGRWSFTDCGEASSVTDGYRKLTRTAVHRRLSPAVVEAQLTRKPYIVLEDFSLSDPGALPTGWRWFRKDNNKHKPYRVVRQGDDHYLAAEDRGSSVILLRWAHWNPREFPILSWCWKVDQLPPGGDERYKETNDSAAGLYVIFSKTFLRVPRQVKYV